MAAVEADRVVIAIIGDTSSLDKAGTSSARQWDANMSAIEASATRAERQIVASSGRVANAQRNIGRQVADIGTGIAGGQSPFLILAQQMPQLADAVADTDSKFARFARFAVTPAGAALLALGTIIAPLIGSLFKQGDEVEKLTQKMRENARQAQLNERADAAWKVTVDGLAESIRKRREEQEKALKTDQQSEREAYAAASGEVALARGELSRIRGDLRKAEAQLKRVEEDAPATFGGAEGRAYAGRLAEARKRVTQLRGEVSTLETAVSDGETAVRQYETRISERTVAGRLDEVTKATDAYTAALGRLRDARAKNLISQAEFEKRLEAAARTRDAAIERANKAKRKTETDGDLTAFGRPVAGGTITSTVGPRGGKNHAGVDIAVPVGTNVGAAAGGTVIEVGNLPGYGRVVIIDHGRGTTTRYAHLSKFAVTKGQAVDAGQQIGLSGGAAGAPGSGNSRGPHLHYELRRNGKPVSNPLNGQFPTDPAVAAKAAEKALDDLDRAVKRLAGNEKEYFDGLTKDLESLEGQLDPTIAEARAFEALLQRIENARLSGLIDDTRALELRMLALKRAAEPLLEKFKSNYGDLVQGKNARLGDVVDPKNEDLERSREKAEDDIHELADLYESLLTGGVEGFWEQFKREGLRALAMLAAQETFKLLTGRQVNMPGGGGGGLGSIFSSIGGLFGFGGGGAGASAGQLSGFSSLFGRSGGGYMPPNSVRRVNEGSGRGVELLRMGAQGGQVIPLGQTRAAQPASGVTIIHAPQTILRNPITTGALMEEIDARNRAALAAATPHLLREARRQVPGAMARFQGDGTVG